MPVLRLGRSMEQREAMVNLKQIKRDWFLLRSFFILNLNKVYLLIDFGHQFRKFKSDELEVLKILCLKIITELDRAESKKSEEK